MDNALLSGRICDVPWEASAKVHTSWDIGMENPTCIIFFQNIGLTTRIIDYYQNVGLGLEHYVKILNEKPYQYGMHFAPHDAAVREPGTGISRIEKMKQLGIKWTLAPNQTIQDGIEAAKTMFSRLWIDQIRCETLIKALENYRAEFDPLINRYREKPLHDWCSDPADAFRYMAVSIHKTNKGTSPEELERRYNEVRYGVQSNMPSVFRDDYE
jgi:hypothetical protein